MGLLALDRGNIKPFIGEQIDWAHPHSKGLICCVPLQKWHPVDLVTGKALTLSNAPPWVDAMTGPALQFNGSTNSRYLRGTLSKSVASGPFTACVWFRPGVTNNPYTALALGLADGTGTLLAMVLRYTTQIRSDLQYLNTITATLATADGWGTRTDRWYMAAVVFSAANASAVYGYLDGKFAASNSGDQGGWYTGDSTLTLGTRGSLSDYFSGDIGGACVWDRALTREELDEIAAAPFDFVGEDEDLFIVAGAQQYQEDLSSQGASASSVTDLQAFAQTLTSTILSQGSLAALQQYLETLQSNMVSSGAASASQGYVDNLTSVAVSADSLADVQAYAVSLLSLATSAASVADFETYIEAVQTIAQSASSITDSIGIIENLSSVGATSASLGVTQQYREILTTAVQSGSALGEVGHFFENVQTTIASLSTVQEQQFFIENLAIVSLSASSLAEMMHYVEQVSDAAASQASVIDTLVGAFQGEYILGDSVRARVFEDAVPRRVFEDRVHVSVH